MSLWISGDNDCKKFADGTQQTPSYVCYFFVFLIVIGIVQNLVYVPTYPAYALSHATLGIALMYIMYQNCVKCNGWRGFMLTTAIGIVVGIVLDALPMSRPPLPTPEKDALPMSRPPPPTPEKDAEDAKSD